MWTMTETCTHELPLWPPAAQSVSCRLQRGLPGATGHQVAETGAQAEHDFWTHPDFSSAFGAL